MNNFPNTSAELARFDEQQQLRDKLWDDAVTSADVAVADALTTLAVVKVQRAFQIDTSDVNSWSHCKVATVEDIRRMIGQVQP